MASKVPIIRQVAWISLVPQLAVLTLIILALTAMRLQQPILIGCLIYLIISISLRMALTDHHKRGVKEIKALHFEASINSFNESISFFEKYPWIDKWRFLTLLSSSQMSYREMALCNIAFAYSQMGEGIKALAQYEVVLKEYPTNTIAHSAVKMMSSLVGVQKAS